MKILIELSTELTLTDENLPDFVTFVKDVTVTLMKDTRVTGVHIKVSED